MNRFPVNVRFPIHWGDMDAFGHVNNTRYFAWFETARIAYFQEVGVASKNPKVAPILARATCDFRRPLTFPGEVVASARVSKIGTTSFTMEYQITLADDPENAAAKGEGVIVMYDYDSALKVAIPDELRAAIERVG
ncbi:MAG: acyl-CoA thioesterase [Deltaproteobacteria bacterium]|nr:acyl-CoA thioesterase [Deltaproteobacteria bacterium]